MIDRRKLAGLMAFYFFVTYAVLVVTFYASFLIDDYKIDSSFSGGADLAVFPCDHAAGAVHRQHHPLFEAERQPRGARAGLWGCCVSGFSGKAMLAFGALCTGLGYGIMQPVIYDKAATIAPPRSRYAGPFVRHVGELPGRDGLPFIVDLFRHVFGTHSDRFFFFQCRAGAGRGCRHTPAPG